MFLMSTLIVISANSIHLDRSWFRTNKSFCCSMVRCRLSIIHQKKKYISRLVPNAKKGGDPQKKRPWWKMLFLDDDYSGWFSTEEEDLIEDAHSEDENDNESAIEDMKFDTWRRRAEALTELRNAQEEARDADNREWEDWLESDSLQNADGSSWEQDLNDNVDVKRFDSEDESDMFPEKRLVQSIKDLVLRRYDDELLFEDKVFNYASTNSAKFVAFLILIPWAVDFVVHDFVLMPFLDRYVKTVPLAAEFLDVRKSQKLQMVKALNLEKARLRFEVEIGKAPPLSDDEVWLELKHRAIEMRDEWRLENRNAFANIWSDIVYGITLFLLIYFNQNRVALLKFTGYKLINNVSETGKAFLIILVTDIFLGYHSASGWEALLEAILERYGLEVDQAAITIFICFFPVVIDACVKLWLFKFLPRVSPNVTNIFREMKRH